MTFGLITEGITDQLVIDTIITTLINDEEEKADTTELCPMKDETGTWSKVFTYIQSEIFRTLFKKDDYYVVIQIDTDTRNDWESFFKSNQAALDHLKTIPEVDKGAMNEIVEKVRLLFRLLIGIEFYDQHQDRIICAISVDEMECWVLPFHAIKESDKKKSYNCLKSLNKLLAPKGYTIAASGSKASDNFRYYRAAIKDMAKKKLLLEKHHHNESLKIFVDRILDFC